MVPVADEPAATANRYCCVTIVTGDARTDVALPSSVPLTDLMPGVIRLLHPPGGSSWNDGEPAAGQEWALTPIGRSPLASTDTLDTAGVVDGDLLTLDDVARADPPPLAASVREAVEDAVDAGHGHWDASATARWAWWTTILGLAALAVPVVALPVPVQPAVAGFCSMVAAGIAVQAGRRGETICAAAALVSACLYGAVGGVAVAQQWSARGSPFETVAVSAVTAALLVSAAVARWWRPAIVMVIALAAVLIAESVLALLVLTGVNRITGSLTVAVAVVMLLGALPRCVLAVTGLPAADPGHPDFPSRLRLAGRGLTGSVLGASACVVAGVLPAAGTDDRGLLSLTLAVGVLTTLRGRVFGQVGHTIGPRIAGTVVIGAVWFGAYRAAPSSRTEIVVGAVLVLTALAATVVVKGAGHHSSVTGARAARALDATEFLLVGAVLVGTVAEWGLGPWAVSVLG